jgi:hypothetical protein
MAPINSGNMEQHSQRLLEPDLRTSCDPVPCPDFLSHCVCFVLGVASQVNSRLLISFPWVLCVWVGGGGGSF